MTLLVGFAGVACSGGPRPSLDETTAPSQQEVAYLLDIARKRYERVPDIAKNDFTIERKTAVIMLHFQPKKGTTPAIGLGRERGEEDGSFIFEKTNGSYTCINALVFFTPHVPRVIGGTEEDVLGLLSVASEKGHTLPMSADKYNFVMEQRREWTLLQCYPKKFRISIDGTVQLDGGQEITFVYKKGSAGFEFVRGEVI